MSVHSTLTGADLHEPKGADSASIDTVYVANGAGTGVWKKLDSNQVTPSTFVTPAVLANILATGAGSPEGVLSRPVGSLYLRTDGGAGTTLYVKETGAGTTGWIGK